MTAPLFRFDISEAVAQFNWDLLRRNDFDLTGLLNRRMSVTSFGSEFKQVEKLEMIFGNHHRWKQLRKILTEGVDFPLVDLDEKLRRADIAASFARGNHKSAIMKENILSEAISKEVLKGWNIILPMHTYDHLPGAVLNPMDVATHIGISSDGRFV